jgi:peptidoglycan/xylan/chitin deacetylase (PgdA/CDA1 family)
MAVILRHMMPTPVCFTLDNLGDAADLYRGNIATPRPQGSNYALEVGVPALLDLCERHRLPITYFVEGWSAEHYPDLVRDMQKRGVVIGMHGWQHEIWHLLEDAEVDTLVKRAHESHTRTLGKPPTIFRAPGGKTTPYTQKLLAELGYEIDASYHEHAKPSRALGKLVNIPYQWPGVDATHWLWHKRTAAEALHQWQLTIDHAVSAQTPITFIFHSHVMGMQSERLAVGEALIEKVLADPRLQVMSLTTLREGLL